MKSRLKSLLGVLCILLSSPGWTCVDGKGFFPDNNLYIPPNAKNLGSISQQDVDAVLSKVSSVYKPIVRNFGGNLVLRNLWSDGKVNAQAYRQGTNFMVEIFGGLARHHRMTIDGLYLVTCHEVGHHIGGNPRYKEAAGSWAANEGQSDYFAVMKCLRKVFENDDNESIVNSMDIDPLVRTRCEEKHPNNNEAAICMRAAMAGFDTTAMFADLSNGAPPRFDRPDQSVVSQTYDSHPAYQCRLDTYFQGSVCDVSHTEDIGQSDPNSGTCNRADGFDYGVRPLCWYKPTNGSGGGGTGSSIAATPTVNGQTEIRSSNPNQILPIAFNLDAFRAQGAVGYAIEISKPNTSFTNPNGSSPDPVNSLGNEVYWKTSGKYNLHPSIQLPGWGSYEIRVIAVDRARTAVGKFSNVLKLHLFQ
ncbi:MAG: hypothetical protein EP319_09015 [Deltaproteobacteria bacterium]|nr:MAG: hypothetical protein EP319_09015 [Deltaproteobacteria bacterium]